MQDFLNVMNIGLQFLKMPITLYGFTFSFWNIILWSLVVVIALGFVGAVISSDK